LERGLTSGRDEERDCAVLDEDKVGALWCRGSAWTPRLVLCHARKPSPPAAVFLHQLSISSIGAIGVR
jgi:hypothetical protein